jgi:hypothetical protein
MRFVPFILVLGLLTGCIPYVHSNERSADIRGRVLDANTHIPLKGAEIRFAQAPPHTTRTDSNGYFHMKATRNWHYLAVAPDGDWPDNKDNTIVISDELRIHWRKVGG